MRSRAAHAPLGTPVVRPLLAPLALATAACLAASAVLAAPPEPASAPKGAVAPGPKTPPVAASSQTSAGLTPMGDSKDPIDITSEGVEVIQPQRLTIFKGNVEETQGTQRLRTPELRVYYKAKPQAAGQPAAAPSAGGPFGADQTGGLDHMEAAGPVYYITPTQNARGDYMTYDKDTNVITLTGNVVLAQGKSVAKGDKLVMNRTTGQSNLISNSPTTPAGRVRVILYPQQQPAPGAPAAKPPAKPAAKP